MSETTTDRDDENEQDDERIIKIIDAHVAQLMEHVDTVEILVTRVKTDGTRGVNRGAGNWYARIAQARLWVVKEDERERMSLRGVD